MGVQRVRAKLFWYPANRTALELRADLQFNALQVITGRGIPGTRKEEERYSQHTPLGEPLTSRQLMNPRRRSSQVTLRFRDCVFRQRCGFVTPTPMAKQSDEMSVLLLRRQA